MTMESSLAEVAASALRGGTGLRTALDALARCPPTGTNEALDRAARLVRLGLPWAEALQRTSDAGLAELGRVLLRSDARGLPLAQTLGDFAVAKREESARLLERAIRRAAILMVVPLVVCVLPAFVLLGLGPFIRGLAT